MFHAVNILTCNIYCRRSRILYLCQIVQQKQTLQCILQAFYMFCPEYIRSDMDGRRTKIIQYINTHEHGANSKLMDLN